mmetsp:Transcript_68652/g.112690  ORF Transcript_68652/g.112690 Transcript_68652/m.112690 type:complete len:224 (+) Transcript_68652:389-1060(+)
MEVHRRELGCGGVHHMDVQGLRLIDVGPAIRGHLKNSALLDLPNRLVEILQILRQVQLLHTSIVSDEFHTHLITPKSTRDQILQQMTIDLHKLTRQNPADVQVLRVGFKRLVVSQDLCGAGGGHRSHQQAVAKSMLGNLVLQALPIPASTAGLFLPEVKLQLALACWATFIGLIGPLQLRQFTGGFASSEVDGLEDVLVQSSSGFAFERQLHHQKCIRQTLNP